ncbi:MAG: hypothetical protein V1771_05635 [Chloroflexota bacterium]
MGKIVVTGLALLIVAIMWSTTTWDVPVVETYYTSQPYNYEQSFVRVNQVRNFPWINEVTQVQYMVKNTDTQKGTFLLNFIFDNGTDTGTKTSMVDILAGEQKAVSMDSPLNGESKVTLKVVPPNKSFPQQRTVTKKVNGWDYLGRSIFSLK